MADELDQYVCSLEKNGVEQAQRELKEIPDERLSALKSFRDWIILQKDWLKSPTDARFLLSFLRIKKFGQVRTRDKFIKYWTLKTNYPSWLTNLDTQDEKIVKIFKQGIFIPIPGHDSKGRKVCISRWGLMDVSGKSYSAEDMAKACAITNEYILREEQTQVGGLVILEDFTGFTLAHSNFLGIDLGSKLARVFTKAYPVRFQGIHDYNNNPVFEALLTAVKPFLKETLMDRFHLHGKSLVPVFDHLEKSSLPVEYLPDDYTGPNAGTIQQLIDNNLADLQRPEVRNFLLRISNPCFGVDENKKPPDAELLTESFRRLETH